MAFLNELWAFLKRDYLLASAARLAFLWQAVSVVFAAPILYYLGRLIEPATSRHLVPFGGEYFGFVIIGVAFFGFLSASMGGLAATIRYEQMIGTLEPLLTAPVPLPVVAVGASLWSVLVAALQALLYVVVGMIALGLDLGGANVLAAATIVVLTLVLYAALGTISASFVLLFRHQDPTAAVFAAASALLGGVFYPTSVLPLALQQAAQVIPLTHALRALRLALLQGHGIAALHREVAILLLFMAILVPLAMLALRWAVRVAKSSGALGAY